MDKEKKSALERAKELLGQMTLKEKAGQLCQRLYGFRCYEVGRDGTGACEIRISDEFKAEVEACGGLGVLYGLFRADPWSERNYGNGLSGELAVKAYNLMQKYVLEHARLPVPMLHSSECPHGHQALDGYLLPVNLATGATFDPSLLKDAAGVCGEQLKGMGVDLALVSALDILRDPRWGRSEECFGEDPYLAGCFAKAAVEGIQAAGVGVVAKHFCAQGETTGGVNASAARIGEQELYEIHLPAGKKCCEAGVKGIMAAYNEIDGVYCHANSHLLNDILWQDFGFDGIVMADGTAVDRLDTITQDNAASAALALSSGVDVGLWDTAFSRLPEALQRGLVTEEEIDRAVVRVLKLKFELGLFDAPYIGADGKRTCHFPEESCFRQYPYREYPQSKRLSQESPVLLKNQGGLLPLAGPGVKIAVMGHNANHIYRQIGDYSPPLREGEGVTLWQGLLKEAQGRQLRLYQGQVSQEAEEVIGWSDVVILATGGSSSRFEGAVFDSNGAAVKSGVMQMDCGEGVDSSTLGLPEEDEALLALAKKQGKKTVALVIAGRPYVVSGLAEVSDALLYAFYPGPLGGEALAELIYGKKSPSGRLPVSLPRSAGQLPVYYNHPKSYQAMSYCDQKEGALYAFGEGMGYSRFGFRDFQAEVTKEGITLTCQVENRGDWEDAAVLQCYRSVLTSRRVPRVRELKAFQKVWLKKGEKRKVTVSIGREFFALYNGNGKWTEQKGKYELLLMDSGKLIWKGEIECI